MVHEINAVILLAVEEESDDDDDCRERRAVLSKTNVVQDRLFMASNYRTSTKRNTSRYAIKRVHKSSIDDAQLFVNGAVDLAVEVRFLAVLRHPNIIKMRGTAATDPFNPERPFFIILDKLDEILSSRIRKWKAKESYFMNAFDCKGTSRCSLWFERLKVAFGIAKALEYVHSQWYVTVPLFAAMRAGDSNRFPSFVVSFTATSSQKILGSTFEVRSNTTKNE
jgi:serine/threonine protein kinase